MSPIAISDIEKFLLQYPNIATEWPTDSQWWIDRKRNLLFVRSTPEGIEEFCELVAEMELSDGRIVQVNDLEEMLEFGVVNPPALVVNGKLKLMGRVLVKGRVRRALEEALAPRAEETSSERG